MRLRFRCGLLGCALSEWRRILFCIFFCVYSLTLFFLVFFYSSWKMSRHVAVCVCRHKLSRCISAIDLAAKFTIYSNLPRLVTTRRHINHAHPPIRICEIKGRKKRNAWPKMWRTHTYIYIAADVYKCKGRLFTTIFFGIRLYYLGVEVGCRDYLVHSAWLWIIDDLTERSI
jgi:hypothetical protein